MNIEQAKFILSAYRAHGADASDPEFAAALELVRQDPELARWFESEQAADAQLSQQLKEAAAPPPHLKAQLLASTVLLRPHPWWRQPRLVAAAAMLLLCGTLAGLWAFRAHQPPLVSFRNQMTSFVADDLNLIQHYAHDIASVKGWLAEHDGQVDFGLPAGLDDQPSIGCRVLSWRHHAVSLICFVANGETVHLFVIDREHLDAPPRQAALATRRNGISTLTWSQDNKTYLLAGQTSEARLRRLL